MILAKFHHVELWTTRFLGVAFLFFVGDSGDGITVQFS